MPDTNKLRIPNIAVLKWGNIADLLAELAGVPAATINIMEEDAIRVIAPNQGPNAPFKTDDVIKMRPGLKIYCSAVIESREKLIIADAAKSDFWKDSEGAKAGFVAYAGVPIFHPNGDIFGSVCVFDRKPNSFEGPIISPSLESPAFRSSLGSCGPMGFSVSYGPCSSFATAWPGSKTIRMERAEAHSR